MANKVNICQEQEWCLQTRNLLFKSFIQNTSGQLILQWETQQQCHLLEQSHVHSFLEKDIRDFITHFSFKFLKNAKKKTKIKKKRKQKKIQGELIYSLISILRFSWHMHAIWWEVQLNILSKEKVTFNVAELTPALTKQRSTFNRKFFSFLFKILSLMKTNFSFKW